MKKYSISIVHHVPGRLRLSLSRPPADFEQMVKEISLHNGVNEMKFNPITRSLLIYYNPSEIKSMEIIVRVGIYLSIESGMGAVNIFGNKTKSVFTSSDNYSLASLIVAWVAKLANFNESTYNMLTYNAGVSTIYSVLKHTISETKTSGTPHPEVISGVYLLNGLINKNILVSSTLTWIITFGRHLASEADNITLQAFKISDDKINGKNYYDVAIKEYNEFGHGKNLIKYLTDIVKYFVGINHDRSSMIQQIKTISAQHGDILEGLKYKDEMVFLRL